MSAAPVSLAVLRQLLAERFPSAPRTADRVLSTGIARLDAEAGGLPLRAITEVVCAAPSCGSHLLFSQLLVAARAVRGRVALVDLDDTFDPASQAPDLLAHLVWVRSRTVAEALTVADILARDANFLLVVLDLRHTPEPALRSTPATTWYRLQRAVEAGDLALVACTPRPLVPSAQLRLVLAQPQPFGALESARAVLATALAPGVQRQRLAAGLAAAG